MNSEYPRSSSQITVGYIVLILVLWRDFSVTFQIENVQKIADALGIEPYKLFIEDKEDM